MIRNSEDLRMKYESLLLANKLKNEVSSIDVDRYNDFINEIKKEIRDYHKREDGRKEWLIKDYGIDGGIVLIELPSEINSVKIDSFELAEEYFKAYEYRRCRPSIYDCTGQVFTSWYKIIKRNNKFYAYHCISFDFQNGGTMKHYVTAKKNEPGITKSKTYRLLGLINDFYIVNDDKGENVIKHSSFFGEIEWNKESEATQC